jgi:hypothetical protein
MYITHERRSIQTYPFPPTPPIIPSQFKIKIKSQKQPCSNPIYGPQQDPNFIPTTQPNMATDPIDYIAIKNVLALYCFALDTKNLTLLSEVLTPDIDAKYPFPGGDMQGLEAVVSVISKR